MTLLITVFAAVISTSVWYFTGLDDSKKLGTLSLMYWGASLMWFVDAVFGYIELHSDYFLPTAADIINDTYLGLSVVALGLVIWLVILFIKDPQGIVKKRLTDK